MQDPADSKRTNANVKTVADTASPLKKRRDLVDIRPLTAAILSGLFWPPLPLEEFTPPHQVRQAWTLNT